MLRYETGQSNSTQEYYVSLSSMSAGRAQNSRSGRRIGTMLQEQFSTLAAGLKQGTPPPSFHTLYLPGIEPINNITPFQSEILICWQIFWFKYFVLSLCMCLHG